jgi:hypothetical protein
LSIFEKTSIIRQETNPDTTEQNSSKENFIFVLENARTHNMNLFSTKTLIYTFLALGISIFAYLSFSSQKVDFNTEVKPILNKKCIACHGGVKQAGGFSLLFPEEALAKTKSGKPAIVPFHASNSEFIRRLTATDPEERMPKKGDPLTKKEIQILTDWVNQGATWGRHWAYNPVEKTDPTAISWWKNLFSDAWAKNDIDRFISEKHEEKQISHAQEADKATLLRRLTLDITGLTPTEAEYQQFLKDDSPNAYEKTVDKLMKSSDFGEKWASMWLDLARYADSKGYEKDDIRSIWRYRDWVIRAFNENKPYDQFITEQLAGDLLPKPTENQLIATAFHRNTMNNDEGGTVDEEFRTSAVLDRVSTTWVAFNSTTFACTQCHSHPYDPFKHEEFYKYMAFFNNTRDEDVSDESAHLRFFNEADSKKLQEVVSWIQTNVSAEKAAQYQSFIRTVEPRIYAHDFDSFKNGTSEPSSAMFMQNNGSCRLPNAPLAGKNTMLFSYTCISTGGYIEIRGDSEKGELLGTVRLDTSKSRNSWDSKTLYAWVNIKPSQARRDLYLIFKNPTFKNPDWDVAVVSWVMFLDEVFPGKGKPGHEKHQGYFKDLMYAKTDNTPILMENPKELFRETKVFERGSMFSQTKLVQPDVPKYLHPFPKDAPRNRLGLAQWIADKENPLTARTMVNRVWEQIFGTGLVETLEDMGTQGFPPTHQALLDNLSYRFMHEWGWQVKPLIKEILMSATYRQDSHISEKLMQKDPANRYLARGPRVRLTGEQIRDQSLLVSDLLSKKMYGKPVMPYQPEGVWQTVYSGHKWVQSTGEDSYRRAIYTMIRRSSPYPSMNTFDGSTRDVCLARRIRTNTPLQALVTLNDSSFVEMSQKFALKLDKIGGTSPNTKIKKAYWLMTGHDLDIGKEKVLVGLYNDALKNFTQKSKVNKQWMPEHKPQTEALAVVLNTMLNMDEFITKE